MRSILMVNILGVLCLGALLSACTKEDFGMTKRCDCTADAPETISEVRGILHFDQQLRKYTIVRADHDDPSAPERLFVLTEVPAGYPLEAQDVIFSGQITPACAGMYASASQQYYDISLSKLKRAE